MTTNRRRHAGFTLVELITVMVLLGIMAAVAAPRFFDRKTFDVRSFLDQSRSLIRYGQKVAVAQNRPVYVRLNGASVALCFTAACANAASVVSTPAGTNSGSTVTRTACVAGAYVATWACEGVPSGASYSSAVTSFYFDGQGQPFAAGDTPPTTISTFTTLTLTVTGDGTSRTIVIEPGTGYVH